MPAYRRFTISTDPREYSRARNLHGAPVTAGARLLPGPTSELWDDVDAVCAIVGADRASVHAQVHVRPQPDCLMCPPTECPCGTVRCPDAFDHRRGDAGSETTWREVNA